MRTIAVGIYALLNLSRLCKSRGFFLAGAVALDLARAHFRALAIAYDSDLAHSRHTRGLAQSLAGAIAYGRDLNQIRALVDALERSLVGDLDTARYHVRERDYYQARDLDHARRLARGLNYALEQAAAVARSHDRARVIADNLAHDLIRYLDMEGDSRDTRLEKANPPAFAERLLCWLSRSDEEVLGSFQQMYERSKCGVGRAGVNYTREVFRSAPGFLRIRLRRLRAAK